MKSRSIVIVLIIGMLNVGLISLPLLTVHADPFATLTFTGRITAVPDAPDVFADVEVGDSWTLTYTFDTSAFDVDGSPTAGQYRNLITYITLKIGSNTVSGTPGSEAIPTGLSSGIFVNLGTSGYADYGVQVGLPDSSAWVLVNLWDDTGTPFIDDSLPLIIPTPLETNFPTLRHFSIRAKDSTDICIKGTVDDEILIEDIQDYILNLPDEAYWKNPDERGIALANKLDAIIALIDASYYQEAIDKLEHDIRTKVDGIPMPQDWVIDAAAQNDLCNMIDALIAYLTTFI